MPSLSAHFAALLRPRVDDHGSRWLTDALTRFQRDPLIVSYTAAPKRVGRGALALEPAECEPLAAAAPGLSFERWTVDDAARAALLLASAEAAPNAFFDTAIAVFEQGDAREQQSWLRAVSLYPNPERFAATAIDACRTNILPLFEAIACENPYPSRYFPERNFNQMVLKALFNSVSLARIVGLAERLNPELTRMAADYAAERRAAGRTVPADIGLAIGDRTAEEHVR
jgi:hypothetical protein